jgi:mannosyltransferase OCH1-like enzyme
MILFKTILSIGFFLIATGSCCSKHSSCYLCKDFENKSEDNKNNIALVADFDDVIQLHNLVYYPGCLTNNQINNAIDKFKYLYNKNFNTKTINYAKKSNLYKIPRIIHNIWVGSDLPILYRQRIKKWIKKHIAWKRILWGEELLKKHFYNNFKNIKQFESLLKKKNFTMASDIARYEILYNYGGLYVDCDFINLKSLDLLHKICEFYGCIEDFRIAFSLCLNGIFGSIKNHPILKNCIEEIKNLKLHDHPKNNLLEQYQYTWKTTGPGLFTKSILKPIFSDQNIECIFFPSTYFAPLTKDFTFKPCPESFSLHHYIGVHK